MTQWIFNPDSCICDNVPTKVRSPRCVLCGLPIKTRIGTITQWIFKTNTCNCLEHVDDHSTLKTTNLPCDELIPGAPYHFVGVTGRGGVATVFKAIQVKFDRPVAVKILNADINDSKSQQNFAREAKSASKLQHPNIVIVQDFGVMKDGNQFLVTEWVDGLTLADYLANKGRISVDVARELFSQVLDGLAHAHNRNVVHRDIKPSNLMLTRSGGGGWSVKIIDFGTAKEMESDLARTRIQDLACSPSYMSPEHATEDPVDHRSDLYSMGCSLFEALTGTPPFKGQALDLVMKHKLEEPPSLQAASGGEEYPSSIESVVRKLLEKKPGDRFQSANDAKRALNDRSYLHQPPVASAEKSNPEKRSSFNRGTAIGLLVTLFLVSATVALILLQLFNPGFLFSVRQNKPEFAPRPIELEYWKSSALHKMAPGSSLSSIPADKVVSLDLTVKRSPDEIACLRKFKYMQSVYLSNQDLSSVDIEGLANCKYLRIVSIVNSTVPHDGPLRAFRKLPALASFTMNGCRLTRQDVLYLSELKTRDLSLCGNKAVANGEAMTAICNASSIEALHLSDCDITDQDFLQIARLPNLRKLDLERSLVTAFGFSKTNWPNLTDLNISYSYYVTDALIEQLAEHCKDLVSLTATGNPGITDESIPYLSTLRKLTTADFAGTSITEKGAAKLKCANTFLRARFPSDTEPWRMEFGKSSDFYNEN